MTDLYPAEEFAVAVLTVDRRPQYLHQTLASLFAADAAVHSAGAI